MTDSGRRDDGHSAPAELRGCGLILRDELAVERTLLANERTLLAYLRSGVALLIAGASIMHFSTGWLWTTGLVSLPVGVVTALIGVVRYRQMNKKIAMERALHARMGSSAG